MFVDRARILHNSVQHSVLPLKLKKSDELSKKVLSYTAASMIMSVDIVKSILLVFVNHQKKDLQFEALAQAICSRCEANN